MSYIESPIGTGRLLRGAVTAEKLSQPVAPAPLPTVQILNPCNVATTWAVDGANITAVLTTTGGAFQTMGGGAKIDLAADKATLQGVKFSVVAVAREGSPAVTNTALCRNVGLSIKVVGATYLTDLHVRVYTNAEMTKYHYGRLVYDAGETDTQCINAHENAWRRLSLPRAFFAIPSGTPATWDTTAPDATVYGIGIYLGTKATGAVTIYVDRIIETRWPKAYVILTGDGMYQTWLSSIGAWGIANDFPLSGRLYHTDGVAPNPSLAQIAAFYANPRMEVGMHLMKANEAVFDVNSTAADYLAALNRWPALLARLGITRGAQYTSWLQSEGQATAGVDVQAILKAWGFRGGRGGVQFQGTGGAWYRPGVYPISSSSSAKTGDIFVGSLIPNFGPFGGGGPSICGTANATSFNAAESLRYDSLVSQGECFLDMYAHFQQDAPDGGWGYYSPAWWAGCRAKLEALIAAGSLELVNYERWGRMTYFRDDGFHVDPATGSWLDRDGTVLPW